MKIQVLTNRISNYKEDFNKAQKYFNDHGVDFQFSFKPCDVKGYYSEKAHTAAGGEQFILTNVTVPIDKTFDGTIFAFDLMEWKTPAGSKFPLLPNTPSGSCIMAGGKPFIMLPISPIGSCYITLIHELMHLLNKTFNCKDVMDTYRENDNPNSPTGNFTEQWKILDVFIKNIKDLSADIIKNTKPTWKYFKLDESTGGGHTISELKPQLVDMVDRAR